MFDYLTKFKNLNDDIRLVIDSPESIAIIEELESKYKVELARVVLKVVVKDLKLDELPMMFFKDFQLSQNDSENLSKELSEKLFYKIADYLKEDEPKKEVENIQVKEEEKKLETIKEEEKPKEVVHKKEKAIVDMHERQIEFQAHATLARFDLKFKDRDLNNKILSLLKKYFKGIKSKIDLLDILSKEPKHGGLGLGRKNSEDLLFFADETKEEDLLELKKSFKPSYDVLSKINRLSYGLPYKKKTAVLLKEADETHLLALPLEKKEGTDLKIKEDKETALLIPEKKEETKEEIKKHEEIEKKEEVMLVKKEEQDKKEETKKIDAEMVQERLAKIKIENKNDANTQVRADGKEVDRNTGKIKMNDIKKVKVMSPVDEIRYLDLVNFRRLSENPDEALVRLGQKLKALEELDYAKMLEGIQAWRQSPVFRLYLKISLEAGNSGMSIDRTIDKLRNEGKNYLNKEDINAIIKFNKSLNF